VYCNLSNGVSNFSELRTFESFDYLMIPPDVWLTWPNDNQIFNQEFTINLYFDYENTSTITNCSGYVDNKLVFIMDLIKLNVINVTDNTVSNGKHIWRESCTNIYGRTGVSENRSFYRLNFNIIPPDLFLTYDLTNTNLTNIFGLNIWSEYEFGYIHFIDNVSLPNVNLSNLINISQNRIFLNSTNLTMLNKSATLTFENIAFSNPRILKDNVVISIPFIFENGTLSFNVSGFSEYKIEETPTTPSSSGGSGGGSGGGGSGGDGSGGSGGGGGSSLKKKIVINQTVMKSTNIVTNNIEFTNLTDNTDSELPKKDTPSNPSSITGSITGIYNKVVSKWFYFILVIIVGMLVFFIIRRKIKSSQRIRYYSE